MPRRYALPIESHVTRMGRPPRLTRADEWELYCYRRSGVAIKTCASMYGVSVPTANRIIAKFREYDVRVEPTVREFRALLRHVVDVARERESSGESTTGP